MRIPLENFEWMSKRRALRSLLNYRKHHVIVSLEGKGRNKGIIPIMTMDLK